MTNHASSSTSPAVAGSGAVRRRLSLGKKLLFAGICLGVVLLLAEGVLRLAGLTPLRADPERANIQEYFWISDARLGFRNRPNGDYVYEWIASRPRVTTDSLGFRNGGGWSENGTEPIVLFLGDSTTFCAEVEDDQTGPAEVARLLAEQGVSIRPLNAGCRGYNTLQSKRMLAECLARFPNIRLVIYGYCDNDYFENLNPGVYAPAWAPSVWWQDEQNLGIDPVDEEFILNPATHPPRWDGSVDPASLVELEPRPGELPWGQPFTRPRPARGWRRKLTDNARAHSAVVNQALFGLRALAGQETSAAPQTLPNGSVVGTFGSDADQQREWAYLHAADFILAKLLREMGEVCQQQGVELLVVNMPHRSAGLGLNFDEHGKMSYSCIPDVNLHMTDDCYALKVDGSYDSHLGPRGTKLLAERLAPNIKAALEKSGSADAASDPP